MEEEYPYFGEVWVTISQALATRWVLLHFPMLWEIDWKTHAMKVTSKRNDPSTKLAYNENLKAFLMS